MFAIEKTYLHMLILVIIINLRSGSRNWFDALDIETNRFLSRVITFHFAHII
jgi:hypothetical protein